jgi:hypothetical protein
MTPRTAAALFRARDLLTANFMLGLSCSEDSYRGNALPLGDDGYPSVRRGKPVWFTCPSTAPKALRISPATPQAGRAARPRGSCSPRTATQSAQSSPPSMTPLSSPGPKRLLGRLVQPSPSLRVLRRYASHRDGSRSLRSDPSPAGQGFTRGRSSRAAGAGTIRHTAGTVEVGVGEALEDERADLVRVQLRPCAPMGRATVARVGPVGGGRSGPGRSSGRHATTLPVHRSPAHGPGWLDRQQAATCWRRHGCGVGQQPVR